MAIKEMLELNTGEINEVTELLKVFSDRNGKYVWKKSELVAETVTNPVIHLQQNGINVDVTSNDVDVTKLTDEFFDGFYLTVGNVGVYCFEYSNGQLTYWNHNENWSKTCYYDASICQLVFTENLDYKYDATYNGSKTYYVPSNAEYVIADELSYPNYGKQDEYWYELLKPYSGNNPLTIGENGATIPANTLLETALQIVNGVQAGIPLLAPLTKWSIRTINNGSTLKASDAEIQHGLGVLPRIIIVSQSVYSSMNNTIRYAIMMDSQASYDNRSGNCSGILHYWFIGGASNTEISVTTTASTFRMNQGGIYYERNCEYTILALAQKGEPMDYYYKQINNGVVTLYGCPTKPDSVAEEDFITKEKYEELRIKFSDAPEDTFESVYYFDWETETYLPRERTHDEVIDWYVQIVSIGTVALEDIPEEYKSEVEERLPKTEPSTEQELIEKLIKEVNA